MEYPKVQRVQVFDDFTLEILFNNGIIKIYDFKVFFKKGFFFPLRDFAFFKTVEISFAGDAISWGDEIGIAKEDLWLNGERMILN